MSGNHVSFGLAGVEPPLTDQCHHAYECPGVEGGQLDVEAPLLEFLDQDVLYLCRYVSDQAPESSGLAYGRDVSDQHSETVQLLLDVLEKGVGSLFEFDPRAIAAEGFRDSIQEASHLAIDKHRVQAFLASEVLVNDRLRYSSTLCDLFDRCRVETFLGEEGSSYG